MRHRPASGRLSNGRTPIMTEPSTFVVVGAGLAGAKAVEALRAAGFDGRIVLFGDEPHLPYERPPLSKGYLLGQRRARDRLRARPESGTTRTTSTCGWAAAVTALDRHAHDVTHRRRAASAYDRLLLATGASPRHLRCPTTDLRRRAYLRTHRGQPAAASRPSARARRGGHRRRLDRPGDRGRRPRPPAPPSPCWSRSTCRCCGCSAREVAQVFADLHREHGVDLRLGVTGRRAARRGLGRDGRARWATAR